jgi:hypothetical protein
LTRRIGQHVPFWVQGPGGNSSVKLVENGVSYLWVKASGLRMDQVFDASHFSKVQTQQVADKLNRLTGQNSDESAYAVALRTAAMETGSFRRPSMETGFHAFLPEKYVLHFHALPALLMAHENQQNPQKISAWLSSNWKGGVEFVEACMPGLNLTHRLKGTTASLIVLAAHGLILQSADEQALDRWTELEQKFLTEWNYDLSLPPSLPPAPMRIYFPDTAVFVDRLSAVLEPAGEKNGEPMFQLRSEAVSQDRDVAELWTATALLYKACPSLKQLPDEIASKVAGLPTEQFRRSLGINGEPRAS